ncbi:NnrU family protein [Sphingomonas kyungheensis]|uniref:NnrU family protein n=1 Tax=Sphingomonas kyungheensis TaxID=1069987 RepID=A0ABU8H203_9SPHN
MTGMGSLLACAATFVGTHLLLSHPLRRPLAGRIGERAFLAVYSLVALATLAAMVHAYRAAPGDMPLWPVGDGLWAVATLVMLIASILLIGSLVGNPALAGSPLAPAAASARGVYAVTRHPMLWSFALWGGAHVLVDPMTRTIILAGAIIGLSLVGAVMQDRKKAARDPDGWPVWQARTSLLPFAAILTGRARFGGFGAPALLGGPILWLAATWAHIPLAGWPAGIWRWIV